MMKKFDFKDIAIVPEIISSINSRSEVNPYNELGTLPIMVAPMDTVVDDNNYTVFKDNKLLICYPRHIGTQNGVNFISVSLDEFELIVDSFDFEGLRDTPMNILVDVANGHMEKLLNLSKDFVRLRWPPTQKLMIGNIANPKTYKIFSEIGVDYVRCGIGGGSACLTSANTGVHYPMASLIKECYDYKLTHGFNTKIVADGGFRNYDDIIKALCLGADYVMLGGVLNKTLESCGDTMLFGKIKLTPKQSEFVWEKLPSLRRFLYKKYRGMSTKEVQKKWGRSTIKTSEGISKLNKVEYTTKGWTDNFVDYLKSAMSYTNSTTLEEFKNSEYVFVTQNALNRYHK